MNRKLSYLANTLTAAAVSLAAITSGAAPAAAGDKDLFRALAGLAAVAVIAGAIQQNRADAVTRDPVWPQRPLYPGWPGNGWKPPQANDGPRLPAACALEFDGPRPATYYAESCLRREGVAYALPQHCAQQIRSRDWTGRVFEAGCLRQAGYRTPRWR